MWTPQAAQTESGWAGVQTDQIRRRNERYVMVGISQAPDDPDVRERSICAWKVEAKDGQRGVADCIRRAANVEPAWHQPDIEAMKSPFESRRRR